MIQYTPTFESTVRQMVQYLPAILIIPPLIVTYVTLTFTGRKLLLREELVVQPPSFLYLRLPQGIFTALGIMILAGLISRTQMDELIPLLANNGLVLAIFLLFVQGLAVVNLSFPKLRILHPLEAVLLTMVIFTLSMQVPVACLGLPDNLSNLRRIHLK